MKLKPLAAGALALAVAGGWFVWANLSSTETVQVVTHSGSGSTPGTGAASRIEPLARGGLAFVINSADSSVSLYDVDTQREVGRIPLLREPHHMALSPDHRFLLVGDTTANAMLFLNPITGAIEKQMSISDPYQFGFSPDGKWLVVNGLLRNQIDIYDAATMALAKRVPVSAMPSHVNFSPDSVMAYVSLQSSDSVVAIDVKSGKVAWKSIVGPTPAGVLWSRGRLLVGCMGADFVAVVDPTNGKVERRIHTAKGAHVLFVPPDDKVIYVTNRVDGSVVVLDPDTLAEIRRFKIPGGPDDMDFAPDGKMWVTRRWAHSVAVVDPASGSYTTLEAGRSPHGIWLNTHDDVTAAVSAKPGS